MEDWTRVEGGNGSDSEGSWCLISEDENKRLPSPDVHSSSVDREGGIENAAKREHAKQTIEDNQNVDEKHGPSTDVTVEEHWNESDQEEVDWGEEPRDTKVDGEDAWDDVPEEASAADLVADNKPVQNTEIPLNSTSGLDVVFSEKEVLMQHELLARVKNQKNMGKTGGKGKNFALQAALFASFSSATAKHDTKNDKKSNAKQDEKRSIPGPKTKSCAPSKNEMLLRVFQESHSALRHDQVRLRRVLEKSKYDMGMVVNTPKQQVVEGGVKAPNGIEELSFGGESADELLSYLKTM